jgi:two-component system CheB/CheR fusion protein
MNESVCAEGTAPGPSYVVGIAGGAGCLAALEGLFAALQAETAISFLVVVDDDEGGPSVLAETLSRITPMSVRELGGEVAVPLERGVVYVAPHDAELILNDGAAKLRRDHRASASFPVDAIFRAVAADAGARAIAVVLSGRGADGALGSSVIGRSMGQVFVQEPTSAAHAALPAAAIAAHAPDFVGTPDQLAEAIDALDERASIRVGGISVDAVLNVLRTRHGQDFTEYKRSTVSRRIERRMSLHRIAAVSVYLDMLDRDHAEVARLVADLQIGKR